ncbi:hypothetical protein [Stenoxybacter acetivorans]|uniref:hypothetical protein n=1 Tax=Stenoxybacter acetivorans TaxID=422441 RepID=UPI00056AA7C1|nr:hypothetical protein [Stenoxybacter acetivorans]
MFGRSAVSGCLEMVFIKVFIKLITNACAVIGCLVLVFWQVDWLPPYYVPHNNDCLYRVLFWIKRIF